MKTIDTYTGETWSYTTTDVHLDSGLRVPAYITKRTHKQLHPARCLPCVLRELNPHAPRSRIEHWKAIADAPDEV